MVVANLSMAFFPASKPVSLFRTKQIRIIRDGPVAKAPARNFAGNIAVNYKILGFGCATAFLSMYIEKGLTFVIGGLSESPFGEIVDYHVTLLLLQYRLQHYILLSILQLTLLCLPVEMRLHPYPSSGSCLCWRRAFAVRLFLRWNFAIYSNCSIYRRLYLCS